MYARRLLLSLSLLSLLSACASVFPQEGHEGQSSTQDINKRPHILLTNDDGIESPGLTALLSALESWADVTVSAPANNQSGSSQSVKVMGGKVLVKESKRANGGMNYGVFGKPADAVVFGMRHVGQDHPFDLVVSGINKGQNVGVLVGNSGTVGAAKQAVALGLPAIAVSQQFVFKRPYDFEAAAAFTSDFAAEMWAKGSSAPRLININVPTEVKGVFIAKVGGVPFQFDGYERLEETEEGTLYRVLISRPDLSVTGETDFDSVALSEGFITITALHADPTDAKNSASVKSWQSLQRWRSGDPRKQ